MSIPNDFCGQWQPHAAHTWQTPTPFGSTHMVTYRQCAGVLNRHAPDPAAEATTAASGGGE